MSSVILDFSKGEGAESNAMTETTNFKRDRSARAEIPAPTIPRVRSMAVQEPEAEPQKSYRKELLMLVEFMVSAPGRVFLFREHTVNDGKVSSYLSDLLHHLM